MQEELQVYWNLLCIMRASTPHHTSICTRYKRKCLCTGNCYASAELLHHITPAWRQQTGMPVRGVLSPAGTGRSRSYTLGRPHLLFIWLPPLTSGTPVWSSLPLLGLLSLPDKDSFGRAPKHKSCSLCMSSPRGSETSSWCWCVSEATCCC